MKHVHYGWVVCITCTLLLFITMGTVSNGFSVYLPYIMDERGLTHAQTSSLVTLRCLTAFLAMLVIGWYYKKVSLRLGVSIAACCAGLSYLLYASAQTYPLFCVGAAVSGLSYGFGSMIPVSLLMNRWFDRHRALALSICATGSGIATIVLPPVTTALVEHLTMGIAFRIEGAAIFLLAALIFAVLRSDPAEKGLAPCGHQEAPAGQETPARKTHGDIPRAAFVLLAFASLFMGAVANPGFVHLSVLFSGEGFSARAVAAIISGTGLMLTLGKLLYGETTDHVGGCKSTLLFGAILVAGHVLCCLAFLQSIPLSVLTAVCMGVGYPIATIGPSVWANDLASPRQYPTVLRRLQVIYAGGALVFATVPGLLADRFGDYLPAYILFSCLVLVSLLLIALSYRAGRKVRTEHKA
jgi:MFS family permease